MIIDNTKGALGLAVNGKIQFIIETKKVPDAAAWLYTAASKVGITKEDCQIVPNNPDSSIHHLCHALAAYTQSGFSDASILVIDGMNEPGGISIAIYQAEGDGIANVRTYPMAHSLGSLYSYGVILCGFGHWDYAGKLMGAAAYAEKGNDCPPFFLVDKFTGDVTACNGHFEVHGPRIELADMDFLRQLVNSMDTAPRKQFDFRNVTIAATIQNLFEQSVFSLLNYMHYNLPSRNLVLTGGCALNCVCNGKIIRSGKWENLYVPNMCEDQGNIVGRMVMEYNQKPSEPLLYNKVTYDKPIGYRHNISAKTVAERIREGQIVAWFEGGSEYGPRALCHRSLLANPHLRRTANRLNEIKGREYWRPLAPVVLDREFSTYFDVPGRIWPVHKTMLATEYLREEWARKLPAVCAPDGSARPQVLTGNPFNKTLYDLMSGYELPILVNTSMNGAGEPICETPDDAIEFCSRNDDVLLIFVQDGELYTR